MPAKPRSTPPPTGCTEHKTVGCELCGSAVLAALIKAGESVRIVGELVQVPFRNLSVAPGHQRQGRGLHLNSVVERSIRTHGVLWCLPSSAHISAKNARIENPSFRPHWKKNPRESFLVFWVQRCQKWPYLDFSELGRNYRIISGL